MSGNGAADGAVPGGESHGDDGESARERARKKARLDRIFRSMYPGQGSSGGDGFSSRHYDEQRPPHHGG